jgi:AraC family transcriptional regulator, positive regulator of tynA and feaB
MSEPRFPVVERFRLIEASSFCVGRAKSTSGGAREFQSRFNEAFETRFRLEPKSGILVAKVTARSLGSLRLAHLISSSQMMSLMPGLPASSSKARFVLTLQVEGTSIVRQHGREGRAAPGDLFVVDASKPFQVETTKVVLKSIYLDADVLREALPGVDRCTAVTVSTRHGTGRIARTAIEELFDPASETDEESVERIARMLPHALSVAFGPHLKSQAPWSRDDYHRGRIKEFALRNLRDPCLDTQVIADRVGLSVRHLHELFVSEPDTLMRWIRAERLRRIKDELADPALAERPIAIIAYDWGFREPAHFSRAFRTAYGVSPRKFRDSIRLTRPRSSYRRQWIAMPASRPKLSDEPQLDCGNFSAEAKPGDRSRSPREMV